MFPGQCSVCPGGGWSLRPRGQAAHAVYHPLLPQAHQAVQSTRVRQLFYLVTNVFKLLLCINFRVGYTFLTEKQWVIIFLFLQKYVRTVVKFLLFIF